MKFYPVVIPTLNRYTHFKNCVESLAKCKYADQTELIIGLDYPAKESHINGYLKIKDYLPTITGFAKITVFERKENFGAVRNLKELISYAYSLNECVILSEDDNIFAYTFLEFINSALETYNNNYEIGSVCGFTPENQYNRNADILLSYDASAWGRGRWRHKQSGVYKVEIATGRDILQSLKKSLKILRVYPMCLAMLIKMCDKNEFYGDVIRTASGIVNGIYQAKPGISLVRNMGHDGSGLHCGTDASNFDSQELCNRLDYKICINSKIKHISPAKLFKLGSNGGILKTLFTALIIFLSYVKYRLSSN